MNDLTANRIAGLCAALWLPLLLIGFGLIVGFSPAINDSTAFTVDFYAAIDQDRAWFGECLEVLSLLFLLGFVARVASVTRVSGTIASWLGSLAVALAAAAIAIASAGIAPLVALSRDDNASELPAAVVATLNDMRIVLHWLDLLVFGVMFVALGLSLLHARALSRTLAWAAIAIGVVLTVTIVAGQWEIADTVSLVAGLWAMVTGVILMIRPARLQAARPSDERMRGEGTTNVSGRSQ